MTPYRDRREAGAYDPARAEQGANLDTMTKAELEAHAVQLGLDVPSSATKAEIRSLIDAEQAG